MKISYVFVLLEIIHMTGTAAVNSTAQWITKDNGCPDEWSLNSMNGRCYFISNQYARFDVAAKKCEAMFSSLASIHSLDEQMFLLPLLDEQRSSNSNYWLGLRNLSSDPNASASWTWIDGSPFTNKATFWGENFPSGIYDCGSLNIWQNSTRSIGHWEDVKCEKPMRYICKNAIHSNMFVTHLASTVSLMTDSYFKTSAQPTITDFDCPKGWFSIHPFISCFYLGKDELTYDIASESCKSRSSVLAKLYSVEELKAVGNWIATERNTCLCNNLCSKFWIGLRFANASGTRISNWIWNDGSSVLLTERILTIASFGLEAPPDKSEQCATIEVGDGNEPSLAVVNDCRKSLRYLCRRDEACPAGFVFMPKVNSCYKLITEAMTWTDASNTCQNISNGAHLVNILNRAENEAVINFLESEFSNNPSICRSPHTGHSPNAWIGAQRILETCTQPFVWKPSDKIQLPLNYTNWFHHQPSCDHGIEYCLHVTRIWSYQWNDHRCNETKCSLCEKRFKKGN